jgi:hypothetical protein
MNIIVIIVTIVTIVTIGVVYYRSSSTIDYSKYPITTYLMNIHIIYQYSPEGKLVAELKPTEIRDQRIKNGKLESIVSFGSSEDYQIKAAPMIDDGKTAIIMDGMGVISNFRRTNVARMIDIKIGNDKFIGADVKGLKPEELSY